MSVFSTHIIHKKGHIFARVSRLLPIAKFNLFYWLVYRHDVEFNALFIDYMLHKGSETTHVLQQKRDCWPKIRDKLYNNLFL